MLRLATVFEPGPGPGPVRQALGQVIYKLCFIKCLSNNSLEVSFIIPTLFIKKLRPKGVHPSIEWKSPNTSPVLFGSKVHVLCTWPLSVLSCCQHWLQQGHRRALYRCFCLSV